MGNVLQGGQGQAPARQATILSGEDKVYVLIHHYCHPTDVVVLFLFLFYIYRIYLNYEDYIILKNCSRVINCKTNLVHSEI